MTQKEGKQDADCHHMILLAKNDIGYQNLLALTTAAHLDGYYYKRRIDKELPGEARMTLRVRSDRCMSPLVVERVATILP